MLPIIKREGRKARANAIVNQLNKRNYDVIIFQEIFHKHSRKIITEGLKATYPHNTPILNKKFVTIKTNGGVMIFSRHPIKTIHEIKYSERTGIDRMSRKGALMTEINFNGKLVQVIGTHLQAFGEQPIMYAQYEQLASALLDRYKKEGVPQLICGDFNTIKVIPPTLPDDISQTFIARLARYDYLLSTLRALDGELDGDQQFTMDRPYNDLCVSRKEYRLLLDYAFLRPNGLIGYSIKRKVQIIRQRWSPEHEDLSDHFGLEAVLTFKD